MLEPTSLDIVKVAGAALDQVLLDNVYETLLKLDDDGDIGPGLAELPEISDDGTVVHVHAAGRRRRSTAASR